MATYIGEELEYLLKESGKDTSYLLAEAMQEGIHVLYRRYVIEAYMMKKIDRTKAIQLLGYPAIEETDRAWQAVESDIRWGMKSE